MWHTLTPDRLKVHGGVPSELWIFLKILLTGNKRMSRSTLPESWIRNPEAICPRISWLWINNQTNQTLHTFPLFTNKPLWTHHSAQTQNTFNGAIPDRSLALMLCGSSTRSEFTLSSSFFCFCFYLQWDLYESNANLIWEERRALG